MNKKAFLLIPLLIAIFKIAKAQDTPDSYRDRINYIFANVDHSKVATGLLSDYGLQVIPPEYYDGTLIDSNEVDINVFRTLYADMDYSRFNSNCTLPPQDTIFNAIKRNIPSPNQPVPIAAMCISYNCFRDDAYTAGLVTVTNDQIFDVAGKNPYQTKTLFAATPLQNEFTSATVQLVLRSGLYYTNAGKTITAMAADMGDGNGFRSVSWDTPFSITYSTSGIKTYIIRFTFSDSSILQSHGKIGVSFSSDTKSGSDNYYSVTSSQPFYPVQAHSGARAYLCLGKGNTKLIKPFIVAKGFDPWKIMNDPQIHFTIFDFLNINPINPNPPGNIDIPISGSTYPSLESYLYNNGYDIIFLDYNDGTDDIKRNAALLEEVIKWVNSQKQANGSTEPNVVMGISMGGLVASYALRQLEMQGYNHQTKTFFTVDSPHNGANVPVGVQAALYHLKNWGVAFCFPFCASQENVIVSINPANYIEKFNQCFTLLNTMAAQQMLIYKVSTTALGSLCIDNTVHDAFMNEYHSMGLPQNCYNLAISDGSGSNAKIFDAGANLINYSYSYSLSWWMDLIAIRLGKVFISTNYPELAVLTKLPGSTQVKAKMTVNSIPVSSGEVYHGRIYVRKKVLWFIPVNVDITNRSLNSTPSMLPIDGMSGGINDISSYITADDYPAGTINETQFCFVPAVSALALKNWGSYQDANLNGYDFISNGQTPFVDYYRPMAASNNYHTSFYTSNYSLANYIKKTLIITPPVNIASSNPGYCNVTLSWSAVSGATNYNIYNSVTNTKISTTATTSYTVTGLSAGTIYNFYITSECSSGESNPSKTISATTLSIPTPSFISDLIMCNNDKTVQVSPVLGAISYTWTVTSPLSINGGLTHTTTNPSATIHSSSLQGKETISVFANLSCGFPSNTITKLIQMGVPFRPYINDGSTTSTTASISYGLTQGQTTTSLQLFFIPQPSSSTVDSWIVEKTPLSTCFNLVENDNFVFVTPNSLGTGSFTVKGENQCGIGSPTTVYLTVRQSGGGIGPIDPPQLPRDFAISPNPATDQVTVTLQGSESYSTTINSSTDKAYEVQLWNSTTLIKTIKTKEPSVQLPLNTLPNGSYFIRVIYDGKVSSKVLFKK